MKYCFKYHQGLKYLDEVDEIKIPYTKDTDFKLIKEKYGGKRIILAIDNISPEDTIILEKIYQDLSFTIETKYPYTFDNLPFYYSNPCTSWEQFYTYCNKGVTDILISEYLAFDLPTVSKIAKRKNIQIRVYPNVAQSAYKETEYYKKFFIRPDDISFYEPFIDVIDFYGNDLLKQDILFEIYEKDKEWYGDLNKLILGLNAPVAADKLVQEFGMSRTMCRQVCIKDSSCTLCKSLIMIASDNDYIIVKDKK